MTTLGSAPLDLRSWDWKQTYKSTTYEPGAPPVDILHDFYIPALRRCSKYDRVAGYFSSSSLAAASQGFSALVGRQGRMRLIVGADLDPDDVGAILEGDISRLARNLEVALGQPAAWPEDVRRGAQLLSWMVGHGFLEVRVAFRVDPENREPAPISSFADGYFHEKWALFRDEQGNRMKVSGSLNESKRSLIRNAENIDIHCSWWGGRDSERIVDAERDFEALWSDKHPHFRVLTLPEATQKNLIDLGNEIETPFEIDGTSDAPRQVEPPTALERLKFAIVRDGPRLPGGRVVGMETAPVEPWPHQAIVARRLVETWPYGYLLCDEVGLGKTIEAGLAIRSLYLSGMATRVLVVAPASLKKQWQRELASKFLLSFALTETSPRMRHTYIHPIEDERESNSPLSPPLNIVSQALISRRERRSLIENCRAI